MRENLGRQPGDTFGRRVRVVLRNGRRPPESWAADGRSGCNWTLSGHPFDIKLWEIAQ